MNKGKMTVFAVMAAVLLTTAIFIVFLNTTVAGNQGPEISLPPAPSEEVTGGNNGTTIPEIPSDPVQFLDITPDNVQSIIKYLYRPKQYYIELKIEHHWSDGYSGVTRRTWVLDDAVRWQHFDMSGNPIINFISLPETVYVWEEGANSYQSYPKGDFSVDDFGQIPTYEDILDAKKTDIVSASYEDLQSVSCVKTVIADSDSGYTRIYQIALDNGLLWDAEVLDGDRVIYRMSVVPSSLSVEKPESSIFSLPDGSNPLNELPFQ